MINTLVVTIKKGGRLPSIINIPANAPWAQSLVDSLNEKGYQVLNVEESLSVCESEYEALSIAQKLGDIP